MVTRYYHAEQDDQARERRLRRRAQRLGLELKKSRARRITLNDHGLYRLSDPWRNWIVAGEKFDLTLNDVEALLDKFERGEL